MSKSSTNSEKTVKKFSCSICDFICSKKGDYNRHLMTAKHKNLSNIGAFSTNTPEKSTKTSKKSTKTHICENCGKNYKERTGLWRHIKNCAEKNIKPELKHIANIEEYMNENEIVDDKASEQQMIYKLVKQNMDLVMQNQDFKQMMIEMQKQLFQEQNKQNAELQKQVIDLAKEIKTTTIHNTTNNNKFNMNIFLNEKCKDALNIMEFVTSLPLNLVDLEETGKQGYVKGLSRILVNGLKCIDVSKRPIHCSDLKRETIYVKDNNVWEKDDNDKNKIKNAIKYISLKNAKQITQWTKVKENEGYKDSYNKKSDQYLKLVYEANGGDDDELNKIIKNITPNVVIDKNEI